MVRRCYSEQGAARAGRVGGGPGSPYRKNFELHASAKTRDRELYHDTIFGSARGLKSASALAKRLNVIRGLFARIIRRDREGGAELTPRRPGHPGVTKMRKKRNIDVATRADRVTTTWQPARPFGVRRPTAARRRNFRARNQRQCAKIVFLRRAQGAAGMRAGGATAMPFQAGQCGRGACSRTQVLCWGLGHSLATARRAA